MWSRCFYMHMYTYMCVYAGAAVRISYMCENKICIHILHTLSRVCMCTYIYLCYPASGVHGPGGYPPYPPPPPTSTGGYIDIYIYRHIRPHVCVYIYTTYMYNYTYIYTNKQKYIILFYTKIYAYTHAPVQSCKNSIYL